MRGVLGFSRTSAIRSNNCFDLAGSSRIARDSDAAFSAVESMDVGGGARFRRRLGFGVTASLIFSSQSRVCDDASRFDDLDETGKRDNRSFLSCFSIA